MIKVGDIIDGRKVTRVYSICGITAYESTPVKDEEVKKPSRKKKEQ